MCRESDLDAIRQGLLGLEEPGSPLAEVCDRIENFVTFLGFLSERPFGVNLSLDEIVAMPRRDIALAATYHERAVD